MSAELSGGLEWGGLRHEQQHHNSTCSNNPVCLPWYNRTGWLGVKHQVTYSLFTRTIFTTLLVYSQGLSSQLYLSGQSSLFARTIFTTLPVYLQRLSSQLYFSGQSSLFARTNCSVVLRLNQFGQLIILFRAVQFCLLCKQPFWNTDINDSSASLFSVECEQVCADMKVRTADLCGSRK